MTTNRKYFSINLNDYRNAHYRVLSKAKRNYSAFMWDQGNNIPKIEKCRIEYIVYRKNSRRFDISNITSITAKFFEDFLVAKGIIKDDDYKTVTNSTQRFGGIDKENPRIEIIVTEVK